MKCTADGAGLKTRNYEIAGAGLKTRNYEVAGAGLKTRNYEVAGAGLKTRGHVLCLLLMGIPALIAAQGNPDAAKIQNPTPANAESITAGQQLYRRYCASCHGANAEGGQGNDLIPAAPDLTDKEWKHGSSDGEIFSVIKNGVPPELNMVPFADQIKDPDIWHIVNYVKSIAKK